MRILCTRRVVLKLEDKASMEKYEIHFRGFALVFKSAYDKLKWKKGVSFLEFLEKKRCRQ